MALSVGHPRVLHSRYVIGCYLIPLGICGFKNNSRRITYGIGCVWRIPSLSPLSSLAIYYSERFEEDEICQQAFVKAHPRRLFQATIGNKIVETLYLNRV